MAATVARMTERKLKEMIETTVERKLLELLGDPDEGLALRKSVRERLLRQKRTVASGKRGEPFTEVVKRLAVVAERRREETITLEEMKRRLGETRTVRVD